MHPIPGKVRRGHGGGSRRAFKQFSWLEVGSVKVAQPHPAHQRVTHTVGRWQKIQNENNFSDITEQE